MTRMFEPLPDNHVPSDKPLVIAPRLAELCFQTAGLWEAGRDNRMALPNRIDRVQVYIDPLHADGPLFAMSRQVAESRFDCTVVDMQCRVVMRMDGYGSIAMPASLPDDIAGSLREVFGD